MVGESQPEKAARPEDLGRLFVERANAGDVEGLVALYEPDAVLALPGGATAIGSAAIRDAYRRLLTLGRTYSAESATTTLVNGDLELTSTRIPGGATAEVARRQRDGSWLWTMDQPNVMK